MVQVKRIDRVWKRRMDIHGIANHQRSALVATQHAGRERPGDLQFLDVGGGDLIELGITRVGVVALLHDPLLGILGQFVQCFVGTRNEALHGKEAEDRSRND